VSYTTDLASCLDPVGRTDGALVPANPFYGLRFHFGMLLGVDDFETEQALHRGKMRLHNAWLHRDGVVWGLGVESDLARGELRVHAGLALDAAGRELHLDADACLNVGAWWAVHASDPLVAAAATRTSAAGVTPEVWTLDTHVVARFRACLARQVPALADPCAGAQTDTAYSRVVETVELLLRPGLAPARTYPYHRLRLLFALEPSDGSPADLEVVAARDAVLARPAEEQPAAYLEAFRRFAAADVTDMAPPAGADGAPRILFPEGDDCVVVLANVPGIVVEQRADGWVMTACGTVDNGVRPSHVATATIQELLCGPLFSGGGAAPAAPPATPPVAPPATPPVAPATPPTTPVAPPATPPTTPTVAAPPVATRPIAGRPIAAPPLGGPASPLMGGHAAEPDAGGPRVDPGSVHVVGKKVTLHVNAPLHRATVVKTAFAVSTLEAKGWASRSVDKATLSANGLSVTLELGKEAEGEAVRLVAHGTGPTPILGENLVPLAGAAGGPPTTVHDGHDFVFMIRKGS